jgi:hypothetical protein
MDALAWWLHDDPSVADDENDEEHQVLLREMQSLLEILEPLEASVPSEALAQTGFARTVFIDAADRLEYWRRVQKYAENAEDLKLAQTASKIKHTLKKLKKALKSYVKLYAH